MMIRTSAGLRGPVSSDKKFAIAAGDREALRRIAERRIAPAFLIVSREYDVVIVSPGLDAERILPRVKQALERTLTERADGGQVFEQIDETTLVRIVPLEGAYDHYTAVFIEPIADRGTTRAAARRYGLTRRETDVLKLVVRSKSTAEIADTLCITLATVGDHVKNLMRKMKCSRRSELIARVYNLDHDSPELSLP